MEMGEIMSNYKYTFMVVAGCYLLTYEDKETSFIREKAFLNRGEMIRFLKSYYKGE
jgi:hypothetical protein